MHQNLLKVLTDWYLLFKPVNCIKMDGFKSVWELVGKKSLVGYSYGTSYALTHNCSRKSKYLQCLKQAVKISGSSYELLGTILSLKLFINNQSIGFWFKFETRQSIWEIHACA